MSMLTLSIAYQACSSSLFLGGMEICFTSSSAASSAGTHCASPSCQQRFYFLCLAGRLPVLGLFENAKTMAHGSRHESCMDGSQSSPIK